MRVASSAAGLLALGASLAMHAAVAALLLSGGRAAPSLEEAAAPAPQLAGETFELPAPAAEELGLASAAPQPTAEENRASAAEEAADGPAPATPPQRGVRAAERGASAEARPSGGRAARARGEGKDVSTGGEALFGAVGERSAADLATAFTRGFPQAASADPVWRTAPLGAAGDVTVVLELDDTGHLAAHRIEGSPSAPLAAGIRRTVALIGSRPFTARAKVTRLRVVARVSSDEVHDGLHGDVFAIGGSYVGGEGSAFFALAIGRRIDLHVRAR